MLFTCKKISKQLNCFSTKSLGINHYLISYCKSTDILNRIIYLRDIIEIKYGDPTDIKKSLLAKTKIYLLIKIITEDRSYDFQFNTIEEIRSLILHIDNLNFNIKMPSLDNINNKYNEIIDKINNSTDDVKLSNFPLLTQIDA